MATRVVLCVSLRSLEKVSQVLSLVCEVSVWSGLAARALESCAVVSLLSFVACCLPLGGVERHKQDHWFSFVGLFLFRGEG